MPDADNAAAKISSVSTGRSRVNVQPAIDAMPSAHNTSTEALHTPKRCSET